MYVHAVEQIEYLGRLPKSQVRTATDHGKYLTKETAFRLIPTARTSRRMSRSKTNLVNLIRVIVFVSKQPILNPIH